MQRTLAATWIKGPYLWLFFLTLGGAVLGEVLYFHVFELEGFLSGLFDVREAVAQQGWWNDERKGVWILGALWGVGVAARVVLRF